VLVYVVSSLMMVVVPAGAVCTDTEPVKKATTGMVGGGMVTENVG
jgi:hypothetical protein